MEKPELTVILTHYNSENYLLRAVTSILEQTFKNFIFLIIDDNSDNCEWLKILRRNISDRRVHIYRSDKNVGCFRIKNAIIPTLTTKYIAFQDADDFSVKNRFQYQYEFLESSDISIVGSSFKCISNKGNLIKKHSMVHYCNFWFKLGRTFFVLHPSVMFHRNIFNILGGFDGTTKIAADTDFFIRASYLFKIRNIKKYLYYKRVHSQSLTNSIETGFQSDLRNNYIQKIKDLEKKRKKATNQQKLLKSLIPPRNDVAFKLYPIKL